LFILEESQTLSNLSAEITLKNGGNVANFGKIVFVSRNHTMPGLPDMNLIVLKTEDGYQAVCIDVEIDAVGSTLKDACKNLKKTLLAYTGMMVGNYNGDLKAAVKDIVETAYSPGILKQQLFTLYLQAKRQYLIGENRSGKA